MEAAFKLLMMFEGGGVFHRESKMRRPCFIIKRERDETRARASLIPSGELVGLRVKQRRLQTNSMVTWCMRKI
jgi:hypothetical protein